MLLRCVDPATALLCADDISEPRDDDDELNDSNVQQLHLLPWFHGLQMENYLMRCDFILKAKALMAYDTKVVVELVELFSL